ncbi:MAG: hypothetical protein AAF078_09480, partial [Planctomycetota bacterium]
MIDDEFVSMRLPVSWKLDVTPGEYAVRLGRGRSAIIDLEIDELRNPSEQYEYCRNSHFLADLTAGQPAAEMTREIVEPFVVGDYTGIFVRCDIPSRSFTAVDVHVPLEEGVLHVCFQNLRSAEEDALWSCVESLRVKPGWSKALRLAVDGFDCDSSERALDATSLDRPRKIRFSTWMDHSMVMIRDSQAAEDENDLTAIEGDRLIEGEGPSALWVTSLTEFDVTLSFCVRKDRPRTRVKRHREAERTIAIPSGKLNVEITTG